MLVKSLDFLNGLYCAYCMGGRNGRMGRLLGLGLCYSEAKVQHMPDDTIEGAELAVAVGPCNFTFAARQ